MVRLVNEGSIGKPLYMYMSEMAVMPEEMVKRYHGPIGEHLWHEIYLSIALFGKPSYIHCFASSTNLDQYEQIKEDKLLDSVVVNLKYSSGALAQIFISWACADETSDPWTFKIKVLGTNGGLHFSRRDVVNQLETLPFNFPLYDEMFDKEIEYFINECILKGKNPLSTLEDALQTLQILKAIQQSFKEVAVNFFS